MLACGLNLLGLLAADLPRLPEGQKEVMVLAWWLDGRATVNLRWLA